jgi:two-component system, chemotaxis family, chemotaxis protein CheY
MAPKILIVDDSSIIRVQCRLVLQQAGYEVVEAWDAVQAASLLKQQEIAFVLCDLHIPVKNGVELIEAMRTVPRLAATPAAIMSADEAPELLGRAKDAGILEWLCKPCSSKQLLELMAKHVAAPNR